MEQINTNLSNITITHNITIGFVYNEKEYTLNINPSLNDISFKLTIQESKTDYNKIVSLTELNSYDLFTVTKTTNDVINSLEYCFKNKLVKLEQVENGLTLVLSQMFGPNLVSAFIKFEGVNQDHLIKNATNPPVANSSVDDGNAKAPAPFIQSSNGSHKTVKTDKIVILTY
jgi:hypothetical protein